MKSKFIVAANRFDDYCVPAESAHRPAAQCVIAGGVWEEETIEFMITNCNGADIITAEAFFGDALPALSSATRGTVWAFEPNPQSFRAAQITILMNDFKNVKLMNCALGAHQEQRKLVVRDFAGRSLGGLSQIVDDSFVKRGNETIDIATIAIDSIVPPTSAVSILHLDLEGFEEFALLGAIEIIERCRPLLILETVPTPDSDAERSLKALGYRVKRTLDANTLLDRD